MDTQAQYWIRRLETRTEMLVQMTVRGAPEIILENQRRLVAVARDEVERNNRSRQGVDMHVTPLYRGGDITQDRVTLPEGNMTQVTHTTEEITPALAEKYLKQNKLNRPIRPKRVQILAQDMTEGRWQENGEAGITFDWNGNVAGGQHTLTAIVRSGVTIRCRVTRGVDPAARSSMNDSTHQRFADDLAVSGLGNSVVVEALLRKAMIWDMSADTHKNNYGGLAALRTVKLSRMQMAAAWPKYAVGVNDAMNATQRWADVWPGNKGVLQFMYWLLVYRTRANLTTVEDFINRVSYGSSDEEDRVLFLKLRKKFSEDADARNQVWWTLRVWNAFCKNEKLLKLQAPKGSTNEQGKVNFPDPYPRPYRAQ